MECIKTPVFSLFKIIISGAKIHTNAKFLPDHIPNFNQKMELAYAKELNNFIYAQLFPQRTHRVGDLHFSLSEEGEGILKSNNKT